MNNNQETMNNNQETICCWAFPPNTPLQKEKLWDDNDNDILFKNNNPSGKGLGDLDELVTINFWCESINLGNDFTLLRKVNYSKKLAIILTYREEDDKRVLIDGFILVNGKKYIVTDFTPHDALQVNGIIYEMVATCNYNV